MQDVEVSTGRSLFASSSGRWAGEQMLKAMKEGQPFSSQVLRTLDTLRKDEWKEYDTALVREGRIRLRAVADLYGAGLVKRLTNGFGKMVYQYERITDMQDADVSMSGMVDSENDRQEYDLSNLPLPIIHKDFFLDMRLLAASRNTGPSLDTTQAETAGRKVAEKVEDILFNGLPGKKYGGLEVFGYNTEPHVEAVNFSDEPWGATGVDGDDMLTDLLNLRQSLVANKFYGPYWVYVPSAMAPSLDPDFKANGDKTRRERLLQLEGIQKITVADKCPANTVIMVQPTSDVVQMIEGEAMRTIQWDIHGGMRINFKAMTIQIPALKYNSAGKIGVAKLTDQD